MNTIGLAGDTLIFIVVFYAALVGGISWHGRRVERRQRADADLKREVGRLAR